MEIILYSPLIFLFFIVCSSLPTINRNSRINFSSSAIPISFFFHKLSILTFQSLRYFKFQISVTLCMYRLYCTKDWRKWPYTTPDGKSLRHINVRFLDFWTTLKCTFIYRKLYLLLLVNYSHRNTTTMHVIGNYFLLYLLYSEVCILLSRVKKLCFLRGSDMKRGVFGSSTWVCTNHKKNSP